MKVNNFKLSFIKKNIILMRANALFKHLKYFKILSKLKIVRYDISIYVCFVLDFFCKSIKMVSQNVSLNCPTSIPKV